MSRSIKGPFVQEALLKRIEDMNKSGKRRCSRPGRASTIFPQFVGHTIASMTEESMYRCM